jgi:hypothetical protein
MTRLLKQHLERVRQRMKRQADKKRSERTFEVGDMVFLKLQPYIQSSIAPRANHKLLFKFYGPYQVLSRVGEVAYQLKLPEGSRIHPVVHVSQLKKALGQNYQVPATLPSPDDILQFPLHVLQRRLRPRGDHSIAQGLIHWSSQPESMATWEDLEELQQRFPHAPAWGQAGNQGRGNVTSTSTTPAEAQQVKAHLDQAYPDRRARRPNPRYRDGNYI